MWPTKCRTGHNDCHGILWVTSRITWLGIDRVANFCMIEKSLGFAVHGLRIAFRDLVRSEEVWPAESFVFPTWRFSYFVVYNLPNFPTLPHYQETGQHRVFCGRNSEAIRLWTCKGRKTGWGRRRRSLQNDGADRVSKIHGAWRYVALPCWHDDKAIKLSFGTYRLSPDLPFVRSCPRSTLQ